MDFDNGGLSPSEKQRQTAAEIARRKVLAAYSSTVENLKNLPSSSRDILLKNRQNPSNVASPYQQQSTDYANYQTPAYQQTSQHTWQQSPQTAEYQRTPIYGNTQNYASSQTQVTGQAPNQPTVISTAQVRPAYDTKPTKREKLASLFKRRCQPQAEDRSTSTPEPATNQSPVESSVATYTESTPANTEPARNYADNNSTYNNYTNTTLKDAPIDQEAINEQWQKYHSAWQDYYKKYYSEYYAKAAQSYLATEKMRTERVATGEVRRSHNFRRFAPIGIIVLVILTGLFLQYNRLIFAPIMAYVSPDTGSISTSIEAVDPSINQTVSPEPRLIIPKLNVDVPIEFGIPTSEVDAAMNRGVAQFSIPGANALPGQIGNLVITGHSAGDIYSSNPYKFIFSGLERLENGDLIYVNYESVRYTYQMVRRETVEPSNVAALIYQTDRPMLTLITCTPLGTSRYRLLITAEQISPSYDSNNIATPDPSEPEDPSASEPDMPANEPSFFESLWQGLFGH